MPAPQQLGQQRVDLPDDDGREPERQLVEQQHPGLATSARPIATACCSPPESCAVRWRRRSRIHPNSS